MSNISLRNEIGKILSSFGEKNDLLFVLDSDLAKSTSTIEFKKQHPDRFVELGISETSAMSVASGLSIEGMVPVYVNFAIFVTGTAWTQLRQACYAQSNIKVISTHPGMDNGPDGASHHGNEDIALSRVIPDLKVVIPSNLEELKMMIEYAINSKGPIYIRVARDNITANNRNITPFVIGKSEVVYDDGNDIVIIYEGGASNLAFKSYDYYTDKGYKCKLINIRSIKPIDSVMLKGLKDVGKIITIENHSIVGGMGSAVLEVVQREVVRIGVEDVFTESGVTKDVKTKYGLSLENVISKVGI